MCCPSLGQQRGGQVVSLLATWPPFSFAVVVGLGSEVVMELVWAGACFALLMLLLVNYFDFQVQRKIDEATISGLRSSRDAWRAVALRWIELMVSREGPSAEQPAVSSDAEKPPVVEGDL